jgi:glutamine amidotransferase
VAHVRAASVGNITLQNAHPFRYQNWLWAHNGTVRPFEVVYNEFFDQIAPKFLALRQGQTDSEVCFLLFLTELAKQAHIDLNQVSPEIAQESLRRTVQKILAITTPHPTPKLSGLTFLATNGEMLLAYRHVTTLFVLKKTSTNK